MIFRWVKNVDVGLLNERHLKVVTKFVLPRPINSVFDSSFEMVVQGFMPLPLMGFDFYIGAQKCFAKTLRLLFRVAPRSQLCL